MKKASASFLIVGFAALLASVGSFAQVQRHPVPQRPVPQYPTQPSSQIRMISEQVNQNLRPYQKLRVADLLRLMRHEESTLEVVSLRIMAESLLQGPQQMELSQRGRIISTQNVRRQLHEVSMVLPMGATAESLELSSRGDIYISSIIAEVRSSYSSPIPVPVPGPGRETQVRPDAFLTLRVHQSVRGYANISLDQLVRGQLGLSLQGAQIERVIVEGQQLMSGRAASAQVELNHRPVGDMRYFSPQHSQLPLRVQSLEEVRSLSLIVSGDAQISEVRIRIGQVRAQYPEVPRAERITVARQLDVRMPLMLSEVLRYESRLIRSIRIEGRSLRLAQSQLTLLGAYSELQGIAIMGSSYSQGVIVLRRPMSAHELRLEAQSLVQIDTMEIEFERY